MVVELVKNLAIERDKKLVPFGYFIFILILISCTFTLLYPYLNQLRILETRCLFYRITKLPCPSCGYTRALQSFSEKEYLKSFLFNPLWIVFVFYQLGLIFVSLKTIIKAKIHFIKSIYIKLFAGLLILNWIAKLLIGYNYY